MTIVPVIRSAVLDDLHGLLELYQQLIPEDAAPDGASAAAAYAAMLAMPGMTVFVADLPGVAYPAATCTLLVAPNLTHGARSQGLIENVVTHASHRGLEVGRALLDPAVGSAWQLGCYRVTLTGVRDEAILGFYDRAGFARGTKTTFEMRRDDPAAARP